MKNILKVGYYLVFAFFIAVIIYSCGKEDEENSTANFNVKLTDAPADYDASKSIVVKGNGKYNLKPVIRAYTEAQDGGIRGTVSPAESQPVVMAIMNEDTVSTYSDEFGKFFLIGLN